MTNLLVRVAAVVCLTLLTPFSRVVTYGNNSVRQYEELTRNLSAQALEDWKQGAAAARSASGQWASQRNEISKPQDTRQAALQHYLEKLVVKMKPSPPVAHIPQEHPVRVVEDDPQKKWTKYYDEAKKRLRPDVEYQWNSNAGRLPVRIRLSDDYIATLQANFDVLMWYRNELDSVVKRDRHTSASKFKWFLDHFVAGLLDGLPAEPEIDLSTGKVDGDKWELDERNLRDQLIMTYRYLVAKRQIYPEHDEFGPADRELLGSMMKIGFLVGAHLDPDWFEERSVNLNQVNNSSQWKKPIVAALIDLKKQAQADDQQEQPCVIAIPPPKPKPAAARPAPAPTAQQVEIIIKSQP